MRFGTKKPRDQPSQRKNGQFDVVGKIEDGYVFFECKYTNSPLNDEVIKEELEQVASTTLKPVQYGFFSKNGFDLKITTRISYIR